MRRWVSVAVLGISAAGAGLAVVLVLGLVGGRSGHSAPVVVPTPAVVATPSRVTPAPVRVPACSAGSVVAVGNARVAYAVVVRNRAVAYRQPGLRAFARFAHLNVNHVPTVFGVLGARLDRTCRPSWYHVQLPLRPNGITGWVRASAVTTRRVHARIVVDLSDRSVSLYRDGRPVFITTAAIGSPSTPTPLGRYYVNQKLVADPLGPFGPAALGISAFSPVLRDWAQGGPIAIHGTNEAYLLGSAVSHGCVRVRNEDVLRLWKLAPTGTPVLIRM
jgi:lipoprotein-anchoring transpeptidase ErfK/SrfK